MNQVRLFLVENRIANIRGADEDLDGGHPALAVGTRDQALRDDRFQHACKLNADLFLLVRREDGNDAVDRLRRVQRVQRGEDQVADYGGGESMLDLTVIAHLAEQDYVGDLTKR